MAFVFCTCVFQKKKKKIRRVLSSRDNELRLHLHFIYLELSIIKGKWMGSKRQFQVKMGSWSGVEARGQI